MSLRSSECPRCGAGVGAGGEVRCPYCQAQLVEAEDDVGRGLTRATRSEDTRAPVSVTFVNGGGRGLELVWLDFRGEPRAYGRLEAGEARNFSSYVGHVWSIRESGRGDEVLRWAAPDGVARRVTVH